jgi:tetratricopeptide (TPR) repeat protein
VLGRDEDGVPRREAVELVAVGKAGAANPDTQGQGTGAPQGAGPLLTRANFNYAVHRVLRVEDDLRAVERWVVVSPDQREGIASLRADVAYHSGRYPEARRMYEELLAQRRSVGRLVALAQLEWKTNHFDRAQSLLDEAQRVAEGEPEESRAWLRMVRGMMESDRGRWEESLAQFREALRVRPGSWVIEEHVAEVLAWLGRHEEARLMYADLVARTQDPEFMDQLADLEARRGQTAQAQALIVRARTIYERRAARFPEATAGHAIEFFMKHAPARALELATLDRAARPGGESQVRSGGVIRPSSEM